MRIRRNVLIVAAALAGLLALTGCQTDSREQLLKTGKSQVELRSFQSRTFDTSNKERTLRTVIATLQDLSFVVDKADAVLGSVTASKLDHTTMSLPYQLRMTVTVRPRGVTQMIVRANATYNVTPVEDPEPYQQFFTAFSKAMFLEANAAGGADYPAPQSAPRQTTAAGAPVKSDVSNAPAKSKASVKTDAPRAPANRSPGKAAATSRDAAYTEAKQAIEQKYERLIIARRKERYGLGCDKSAKRTRTQACQDVAFQIQLLQQAQRNELDTLERKQRRVARASSFASSRNGADQRSREETTRSNQRRLAALKAKGPWQNCELELTDSHGTDPITYAECRERQEEIEALRKATAREYFQPTETAHASATPTRTAQPAGVAKAAGPKPMPATKMPPQTPALVSEKSRDAINRSNELRLAALKAQGPWQDCLLEVTDSYGRDAPSHAACQERREEIIALQKELAGKRSRPVRTARLPSQPAKAARAAPEPPKKPRPVAVPPPTEKDCKAGTFVNLVQDKRAIESAIEDFAFTQGVGEPHPSRTISKFNKLTPVRSECGQVEILAAIELRISMWSSRDPEQIHKFVIQKEHNTISVVGCSTC